MTALVTGLTGGLGRALLPALRASGYVVVGISRRRDPAMTGARFVEGDIALIDWETVGRFDVAFHLAAFVHNVAPSLGDRVQAFAVNVDATRRLAEACLRRRVPLVFASTVAVFGAFAADSRRIATDYAVSKLEAERVIVDAGERGLRYAILRFPLLYGPYGRGNMERLMRAIHRRRYWPIDAPGVRKSCLFFADAARALVRAAGVMGASGTFVVSPSCAPTLAEIQAAAYAALHRRMPRPSVPAPLAALAAHVADDIAPLIGRRSRLSSMLRTLTAPAEYDGAAFAVATGFAPSFALSDGMRRTAEWIQRGVA